MTEPDAFAVFSASLPLRVESLDGAIVIQPTRDVRPWNGRALTWREIIGAETAAVDEYIVTGSLGLAAQAAHEWLSEHAA